MTRRWRRPGYAQRRQDTPAAQFRRTASTRAESSSARASTSTKRRRDDPESRAALKRDWRSQAPGEPACAGSWRLGRGRRGGGIIRSPYAALTSCRYVVASARISGTARFNRSGCHDMTYRRYARRISSTGAPGRRPNRLKACCRSVTAVRTPSVTAAFSRHRTLPTSWPAGCTGAHQGHAVKAQPGVPTASESDR